MLNNKLFVKVKPLIELKLREYPYYLISIEMPGLGSAISPDVIINKSSSSPSDIVGANTIQNEYKRIVVNAVNYVYDRLDEDSKKIVDNTYFTSLQSRDEIIDELRISKNKYYSLKNRALYKFGIAFGML